MFDGEPGERKNLAHLPEEKRRGPPVNNLAAGGPQILNLGNWFTPVLNAYPNFLATTS